MTAPEALRAALPGAMLSPVVCQPEHALATVYGVAYILFRLPSGAWLASILCDDTPQTGAIESEPEAALARARRQWSRMLTERALATSPLETLPEIQ